ncbi:hypothetical protein [Desertivirga brevis]|uniref:hypothetical protein n=1 Tax=Desertivirga brevis TaxID=2810310 RepID=UPI001A95FF41|nr:hypothetical protein [Pedobacter sp. SYSU D00873]
MHKILLFLICFIVQFQSSNAQWSGSWIKVNAVYRDNAELEESNPLKYNYIRYNFAKKGRVNVSTSYQSKGTSFAYQFSDNHFKMNSDAGFVVNEFIVEKATEAELVLLQNGSVYFQGEDCIRLFFVPESSYQKSFVPSSDNILAVAGVDTVYIANDKLYPYYNGSGDYFDVLKEGVPSQPSENLYFFATYIVGKDGRADSLKIIESFSPAFDKKIIKNFNKTKDNWQPAKLNGKAVAVQMKQEYHHFSSNTMLPVMDYSMKGSKAMKENDFTAALYFFDKGLEKLPTNIEMLYKRALCKYELGNKEGACKDLNLIQQLGDSTGKELLQKWCK